MNKQCLTDIFISKMINIFTVSFARLNASLMNACISLGLNVRDPHRAL